MLYKASLLSTKAKHWFECTQMIRQVLDCTTTFASHVQIGTARTARFRARVQPCCHATRRTVSVSDELYLLQASPTCFLLIDRYFSITNFFVDFS